MVIRTYRPVDRDAAANDSDGEPPVVYGVEDDRDLQEVLEWTLTGAGYRFVACDSAASALETISPSRAGCILIDLGLPDMDGLELQRHLLNRHCSQPFIVLTGTGDIARAVQALHAGAVDFLQKPFNRPRLLERVGQAIKTDGNRRSIQRGLDSLTEREREILGLLADGRTTKEIALKFGISPRTVDVHRHHILKKMRSDSLVQLMRTLPAMPFRR